MARELGKKRKILLTISLLLFGFFKKLNVDVNRIPKICSFTNCGKLTLRYEDDVNQSI